MGGPGGVLTGTCLAASCPGVDQIVEFLAQTRLAACSVVRVNDTLVRRLVQRADRITDGQSGIVSITLLDQLLGATNSRPGGRDIDTVSLASSFGNVDSLRSGLDVRQDFHLPGIQHKMSLAANYQPRKV